ELGGLYVLATERHEARRIDNQLRGRSGRQGDPGESRFYLSLEDDLMRRFATDRVQSILRRLRIQGDRASPAPGGIAELRNPQERLEVRRGDESPAHRDLRMAQSGPHG